jgi:hypothetical protein
MAQRAVFRDALRQSRRQLLFKKQEINYLVMILSRGLHPDKEQWSMNEVIKCEMRYTVVTF